MIKPSLAVVLPLWMAAGASLAAQGAPAQREVASPRAAVEAKFAAVNRHDLAGVVASYAPDATVTAADFCAPRVGRAEVERTYRAIFAAAPDVKIEITDLVAEGPRVAVKFVLSAGGGAYKLPIMDFFTVENGLITRDDGLFDNRGQACKP